MEYKIIYTESAANDIKEKFLYITKVFRDRNLAQRCYLRLKSEIQKDLSFMPAKYQLYDVAPWNSVGIRLFISRQDVILYSVDKDTETVYIHAVCTKGQDIENRLEEIIRPNV